MCGIIGIVSHQNVVTRIVDSLKRLEYRGYDSAGVAVIEGGEIRVSKVAGKIEALSREASSLQGFLGIGHTRWATHGDATVANAHPHTSNSVAVVHNGIIENYNVLRSSLEQEGVKFLSQTDTEVIPHLMEALLAQGFDLYNTALSLINTLEGAYAIGAVIKGQEKTILALKKGAPLAIGIGEDEMFIGSDALALAPFTKRIVYLEDGDFAIIKQNEYKIYNHHGKEVERPLKEIASIDDSASKGNFKHFMLKEINEEAEVLKRVLSHYYDGVSGNIGIDVNFKDFSRIYIIACGTSFYAANIAKYWIEKYARIPVEIDIASEFRYRSPVIDPEALAIFISQSGETSDTLAALKDVKGKARATLGVVNVEESSIANAVDHLIPIKAGYEIGVASTKAFVNQLAVLALLTIKAASDMAFISQEVRHSMISALFDMPAHIDEITAHSEEFRSIANHIKKASTVLFLGRGSSFPVALEGALKLKELSYIHAEGFAAGELKHGPIALIDDSVPVIAVAPFDEYFAKTASNVAEVKARNGVIISLSDHQGLDELAKNSTLTYALPSVDPFVTPILYAIPLQLLAYHAADLMGKDVDQPRNLAKSVTVE